MFPIEENSVYTTIKHERIQLNLFFITNSVCEMKNTFKCILFQIQQISMLFHCCCHSVTFALVKYDYVMLLIIVDIFYPE